MKTRSLLITILMVLAALLSCQEPSLTSEDNLSPVRTKALGLTNDIGSIALLLKKSSEATGTVTVQVLNSKNVEVTRQVVDAASIPSGTHWFFFNDLKFGTSISLGETCRLRVWRSDAHIAGNTIYWVTGPRGVDSYPAGTNNRNSTLDFAFQVSYTSATTGNLHQQQQLKSGYGYALSPGINWQQFVMPFDNESSIGEYYQGGRIIYVLQPEDAGYEVGVTHGLIGATGDAGRSLWGCCGRKIVEARNTAIGTGLGNTAAIIAQCDGTYGCSWSSGITPQPFAAKLASEYVDPEGLYHDWYLPSKAELMKLYEAKNLLMGFDESILGYWSSSECDLVGCETGAWRVNFESGSQTQAYKDDGGGGVRAIRSF